MIKEKFIPVSDVDLDGNERKYLLEAFDSGWLSGSGPFVERFEEGFADYCGASYGLACANGTVAIHLALMALGTGPGDEVIVPSLTYIATANAVRYCGATPVFADCHPDTWNITADTIEPLITERTKGIIVVPLYGNPVEIEPVAAIADKYGLFMVEDSAEAHGAEYGGQHCGTFGDIATFSFYGNKLMTTGEGGMVITNDERLFGRMKLLRGQGMDPDRRYWFPVLGYNYRLTNLQCAIGLAQLERIPQFLEARRKLAVIYTEAFMQLPGITLQTEQAGARSSWWMFSIRVQDQSRRDRVMSSLELSGIETRPLFWPLHMMPPYEDSRGDCPVAVKVSHTGLNLPTGAHVTEGDVQRIVQIIEKELS
jgi:perosamine synthetase